MIWGLQTPWGTPRFYPPGTHPAAAQWREQLRRLNEFRLRVPDTRDLLEMIDYYERRLFEFEVGETEAKLRAYEAAQ